MFDKVRMVKTEEEIRRLTRATEVIEAAYQRAIAEAHEGMTEAEMAKVFDGETVRQGCDPIFTVIAFGDRSALPNATPGDSKLRAGDIIRFDIGCRSDGYYSDIARTAIFGDATAKQKDYYRAILEGEQSAFKQACRRTRSSRRRSKPHERPASRTIAVTMWGTALDSTCTTCRS
jgi:Xaa-Pro aminopeptidase